MELAINIQLAAMDMKPLVTVSKKRDRTTVRYVENEDSKLTRKRQNTEYIPGRATVVTSGVATSGVAASARGFKSRVYVFLADYCDLKLKELNVDRLSVESRKAYDSIPMELRLISEFNIDDVDMNRHSRILSVLRPFVISLYKIERDIGYIEIMGVPLFLKEFGECFKAENYSPILKLARFVHQEYQKYAFDKFQLHSATYINIFQTLKFRCNEKAYHYSIRDVQRFQLMLDLHCLLNSNSKIIQNTSYGERTIADIILTKKVYNKDKEELEMRLRNMCATLGTKNDLYSVMSQRINKIWAIYHNLCLKDIRLN